jgi:hypothetical protein
MKIGIRINPVSEPMALRAKAEMLPLFLLMYSSITSELNFSAVSHSYQMSLQAKFQVELGYW